MFIGVTVPKGSDTDNQGIPGTVTKVAYEKWNVEVEGKKEPREGIAVYCKGWNFPRQYSVKVNENTGSWESGCMAMKFANQIVKLGITSNEDIKSGAFDFDSLVGRTFMFKPIYAYRNPGQKGKEDPNDITNKLVWLPVEVIDGSSTAEPTGSAADPVNEVVAILSSVGGTNGLTTEELSKSLIQKDAGLAELWYSGLRERTLASGKIENRGGRLYVKN